MQRAGANTGVLKSVTEGRSPLTDDREKQTLADWSIHPGHQLMRDKFLAARSDYYTQLGETLYKTPDLLDSNDLKCKAAFFRGALWILNDPVFTRKALERKLEGVEDA
jgi:hypothetical protein